VYAHKALCCRTTVVTVGVKQNQEHKLSVPTGWMEKIQCQTIVYSLK